MNQNIQPSSLESTHFRLTPAQKALAALMAEQEGCSMAALVRALLEERAASRGLAALGDGEVWRVVGGCSGNVATGQGKEPLPAPDIAGSTLVVATTERELVLIDCKQFEPLDTPPPAPPPAPPVELAELVALVDDIDRRTSIVANVKRGLSALERLLPYAALLWIKAKAVEAFRAIPESALVFVEQHLNTVQALSAGQRLRYLDVLLW